LRFYFFSTRFDFGDNHKAGLGFCRLMAFAYYCDCNSGDGYYPTPGKHKKTARRDRKQNLEALNL